MANGTIKQRSKDSYTLIAPAGKDPETGRYRQVWRTVKRLPGESNRDLKSRAADDLHDLMATLSKGKSVTSSRTPVREYLAQWLEDVRPNLSPRTASGYASSVRDHVNPVIGDLALSAVEPSHVRRVYGAMADKGLSANTRLHVHRMLKKAFQSAKRDGVIADNPCDNVDAPRISGDEAFKPHELTVDEARRLLVEAESTRSGVLVLLLTFTGLRLGEALGLRWSDVDLDDEVLNVRQTRKLRVANGPTYGAPKTTKSQRSVDLDPSLVTVLRDHRQQQLDLYEREDLSDPGFVFTVIDKHAVVGMSHDHAFHDWSQVRERAGVPKARLHDLRHFAATTMIAARIPINEVSALLGHTLPSTTVNIYAHVLRGRGKAAVSKIGHALNGTEDDDVD